MKRLLLILLLYCSLGYSQDTNVYLEIDSAWMTIDTSNWIWIVDTLWITEKDTIPIIYEYSDTTFVYIESSNGFVKYYDYNIYWDYGYLIENLYEYKIVDIEFKEPQVLIWNYKIIEQ